MSIIKYQVDKKEYHKVTADVAYFIAKRHIGLILVPPDIDKILDSIIIGKCILMVIIYNEEKEWD